MRFAWRVPAILAAGFLVSRVIFYLIGVRFDASPLFTFWQFLDVPLLQHRLLESVWYLHSQPPLFNVFLGLVLKLSSLHAPAIFHGVYVILGLIQTQLLFVLLKRFGMSEKFAFGVALFSAITPVSIVFENWLFYDYPLATLFLAMTFCLHQFFEKKLARYAAGFFTAMLLVVLMRSLFHAVWVVAVTSMIFYFAKDHRKLVFRAAAIPLLLIALFYAKNVIQFGSLTGSTWFGQHLARVTTAEVDENIRKDLVAQGKLTPTALIPAFSELDRYNAIPFTHRVTGIPALDQPSKISGAENFNNAAYIQISEMYKHDALFIATHYPKVLATSIFKSSFFYLRSPEEFYMLRSRVEKLGIYDPMFRAAIYGELAEYPDHTTKGQPGYQNQMLMATPWIMLFVIPMVLLFAIRVVRRGFREKKFDALQVSMMFIAVNLLFVSVIANIFEMGENNRIRYMMDPLFLLLGSVMMRELYAAMRSWQGWGVSLRLKPKMLVQAALRMRIF